MRNTNPWELTILDALPGAAADMYGHGIGDLDNDGMMEIITADTTGIRWYKPDGSASGLIATGIHAHCGMVVKDVDNCGIPEIFIGTQREEPARIVMLKADKGPDAPWSAYVIDGAFPGGAHDVMFADIDGDGKEELVVIAMYTKTPGVYVYRPGKDITETWGRFEVQAGISGDGLDCGTLDDSGTKAIIQGPFLWRAPESGAFAGPWTMETVAPGFREMGRTRFLDITGSGKDDLVICEAEYPDGRLSWFTDNGDGTWEEHLLDTRLNFCHSLQVWTDAEAGTVNVLVAEMAKGGWQAPYNWGARTIRYSSADHGKTWERKVLIRGQGIHDAIVADIDGDGALEIVGKEVWNPRVMVFKQGTGLDAFTAFKHRFIDRTKPGKDIDIHPVTVAGRTGQDVICGNRYYRQADGWSVRTIPGVEQVLARYDIDGDGTEEIIAMAAHPDQSLDSYAKFSSNLCWVKPVDPAAGKWEVHTIGTGSGDWPHGALVAPLLPGGKPALVTSYHSCTGDAGYPEIWEIPEDPTLTWTKRPIAEIVYKEELLAYDLDGNGLQDVIAGNFLLRNNGDGTFTSHQVADIPVAARTRLMDVNGNGHMDLAFVEEDVDYKERVAAFVRIGWLENPGDPWSGEWKLHMIDTMRSPHSLDVFDLDGDGEMELIVGEHDPFKAQRSCSRLAVYKKADPGGNTWKRFIMDDRFEHHCGTKVIRLENGEPGIVSHGWTDNAWVHLWKKD